MHIGCGALITHDSLALRIHLGVVLVTVMRFGIFLRPTCIAIFLPALSCVGLKAFGALACFDLRVLLAGITLMWGIDEARVYDTAFTRNHAFTTEL
jgi:hypothetical protein